MKSLLCSLFAIFIASVSYCQKNPFKFGKIDPQELAVTVCPIDSGADAYIIGDYGNTSFQYSEEKGFQTVLQRHMRIKILKKTAFHWADVVIGSYFSGSNEEKVESIKGNTFNLENGKIVVNQLEKNAIFKEEVSEHRRNVRFTLPNVKEGSVIEISYRITSDFYTVWDWNFQQTIPIIKSQYQVEIPEYFTYKTFQNGYDKVMTENNTVPGYITINETSRTDVNYVTQSSFHSYKIDFLKKVSTYTSENVAAFHDEPYMKSRNNYITSMEFELQSIQMPHSLPKDYTSDWKHISEDLLKSDYFGVQLSQGGTKEVLDLFSAISNPEKKAIAIYNYVQNNIKWNGYNRLYASKGIRKILDDKSGNSADINLLLVNLLRKSDLKAYPVILSTRDNGMILMGYPVLQKINYVIACVELDGKRILLDATDKQCPFGFIPDKCLNDQGRIIDETAGGNIDLTSNQKYVSNITAMLNINNDLLTGSWNEAKRGYCAYKTRSQLEKCKGTDEYFENIQKENEGLTINKFELINKDSIDKDIRMSLDVSISGKLENTGDLLIVHPLLFEQVKENPFKYEKRNFPVDYSYPHAIFYSMRLDIPVGYKVESLPKSTSISLPDNAAKFSYIIENKENYLQVVRKFTINKVIFLPEEYSDLKEFYNQMVNKEAEVIVLKKI